MLAVSLALIFACASSRGRLSNGYRVAGAAEGSSSYSSASWNSEPLSWAKLEAIEDWLESDWASTDPSLRAEAVLQLAEGRLELADQRAEGDEVLSAPRLDAASQGFDEVLADVHASVTQKSRARLGQLRLARLEDGYARETIGYPVITRAQWGAARAIPARMTRNSRPWTRVTVHHSAEASGGLTGDRRSESEAHLRRMQAYHMGASNRWGDLGYHFIIDPAGRVFEGRSLDWQGAHAKGRNNVQNIGVCLLGNFEHKGPDSRALAALEELLDSLRAQHGIGNSNVYGHQELVQTACPGAHLMRWIQRYRS